VVWERSRTSVWNVVSVTSMGIASQAIDGGAGSRPAGARRPGRGQVPLR
jgi:hypothetical protein